MPPFTITLHTLGSLWWAKICTQVDNYDTVHMAHLPMFVMFFVVLTVHADLIFVLTFSAHEVLPCWKHDYLYGRSRADNNILNKIPCPELTNSKLGQDAVAEVRSL